MKIKILLPIRVLRIIKITMNYLFIWQFPIAHIQMKDNIKFQILPTHNHTLRNFGLEVAVMHISDWFYQHRWLQSSNCAR